MLGWVVLIVLAGIGCPLLRRTLELYGILGAAPEDPEGLADQDDSGQGATHAHAHARKDVGEMKRNQKNDRSLEKPCAHPERVCAFCCAEKKKNTVWMTE